MIIQRPVDGIRTPDDVAVYERGPAGQCSLDAVGVIVNINATFARWLQIDKEKVIGRRTLRELVAPGLSQLAFDQAVSTLLRRGFVDEIELDCMRSSGGTVPIVISGSLERDALGTILASHWAALPNSERRRTDQLVREGEARFRIMADSAPVALWLAGRDAKCEFFNQHWLDMTGHTMEQEIGDGWAEGVHPMDFQPCMDTYLTAFNARQPFRMEYRLRVANGDYRWILDHGVPRFTPDGSFAGYIGSCIDITDIKRAEAERNGLLARERAARAEAEAAVRVRDEFLVVAAHELKTPLTSLLGSAQLLERQISRDAAGDPEMLSRRLRTVSEQGRRLGRLIGHLLDASRIQLGKLTLDYQDVDLGELVNRVVAGRRENLAQDRLRTDVAERVIARIDSERIEQVLENLIDNAAKFSPARSAIEVTVRPGPEQCALLTVRDHGIGIPVDKRGRIFDQFHQAHAHEHRSGLGLGLFISRQIVQMHRGQINVEFPDGGGTRFVVALPLNNGALQ